MDTFIIYGRIILLCPTINTLKNTSIYKVVSVIAVFCILANVPINLSLHYYNTSFRMQANETIELWTYSIKNVLFYFVSTFFTIKHLSIKLKYFLLFLRFTSGLQKRHCNDTFNIHFNFYSRLDDSDFKTYHEFRFDYLA